MSLAETQAAFMRAILNDDAPLPSAWGNSQAAGMAVYRGNYRFAVMDALASSFERTARYVGENAFRAASMHHAITHPPVHWTIEAVGKGFDATCAELFGDNPEVAELAWLEWAMLEAAGAADDEPLAASEFAAASTGFTDNDWASLKLTFRPRTTARVIDHDLASMWRSLDLETDEMAGLSAPKPRGVLVWREGERPTFLIVEPENARALCAIQQGACYGELIGLLAHDGATAEAIQQAAMKAGALVGLWLNEGMISSIET